MHSANRKYRELIRFLRVRIKYMLGFEEVRMGEERNEDYIENFLFFINME